MDGNCIQYRVSGSQSEVSLSFYSAKYRLLNNTIQNRQVIRSLFFQVSLCIFLGSIRHQVVVVVVGRGLSRKVDC
jgi:hypothetical protein